MYVLYELTGYGSVRSSVHLCVDCFGRFDLRKGLYYEKSYCFGRFDLRKGLYYEKSFDIYAFAYDKSWVISTEFDHLEMTLRS